MTGFSLARWTRHPGFFIFYFVLGLIALSFTFESSKLPEYQLSSVAARRGVASVADQQLLTQLEKSKQSWSMSPQRDFAVSPSQIELLEMRAQKQIPKRFKDNPVFQILEKFMDESTSLQYEDVLACDKKRQYYENQLLSQTRLGDLLESRQVGPKDFSQTCIVASMNHFNAPKNNFAYCARPNSMAQIPGGKPCVTPNLVNVTYNSFMDVSECLNLNPKLLLPKIDFESGFFLNAYGSDKEGGIGQLTRPAIDEVNSHYDSYMNEVEKAALTKPACARLMKFKGFLGKVPSGSDQRCALMAVPENPLRNILYMALFNRINMDKLSGELGLLKTLGIKEKLIKTGISDPDMNFFKEVTGLAGYNMGVQSSVQLLNSYLNKRIAANLPLKAGDFDFNKPALSTDLDGEKRSVVDIARSYVMSSFVSPVDSTEIRALKLQRRKELPELWKNSFSRSFPEFLAYNANTYDGQSNDPYLIFGFPGYLNALASRNKNIRAMLENGEMDPNICSDPEFLKMKSQSSQ